MQDKSTDNSEAGPEGTVVDETAALEPDQRLRAAREARGISVDEVAHDLHLDREIILSLEAADYAVLGAPVFVRGYLRSYAHLLGLPEDEIVAGVAVPDPGPEEFRTMSTRTEVKQGASMVNFVLWVLLAIVVLAGVVYLLVGDDKRPVSEIDKGEFVAPATTSAIDATVVEDIAAEEMLATGAAVIEPEVAVDEPAELVVEMPLLVQLKLTFTEECWVEVSDAHNRLLYGLEKPGTSVNVEGVPPFRLFLGNVNSVTLELGGEVFDVPRSSQRGNNTARFVISAAEVPGATQ
jgi:cytoskeleton protein RodZ